MMDVQQIIFRAHMPKQWTVRRQLVSNVSIKSTEDHELIEMRRDDE